MTQILLLGFCRKATDLNESRPKVKSVQSVPLDLWIPAGAPTRSLSLVTIGTQESVVEMRSAMPLSCAP